MIKQLPAKESLDSESDTNKSNCLQFFKDNME